MISSVVSPAEIDSLDHLAALLRQDKFHTFNRYCASKPQILGVIESQDMPLSSDTMRYSKQANVWITVKKQRREG